MAFLEGFGSPLISGLVRIFKLTSGPSSVMFDHDVINHVASLTVHSVHGCEVTLNCQATYYKRIFRRLWVPTRRMAVYRISAIVTADAPQSLRDVAGEFTATFPRECLYWMGETHQKQRAIEAYLDLLLAKLDRRQSR